MIALIESRPTSWRFLHTGEASIAWTDKRMNHLGSNLNYIDFLRVRAIEWQMDGGVA